MIIVAGTATVLSSCSKEKTVVPLVDQLSQETSWQLGSVKMDQLDITQYVIENVANGDPTTKGYVELHVNSASAPESQSSSSRIYTNHGNSKTEVPLEATRTNSPDALTIVVKEESPAYIGYQGEPNTQQIPAALFQNNMIMSRCDGNCWYQFTRNSLSGTYKILKTTDGYRLTSKEGGHTIEWNLVKI